MNQKASFLTAAVLSLAVLTACNAEREGENNAVGDEDVVAPAETAMVDDPTATASVNDPLLAEGAPAQVAVDTAPVTEGDALGMIIVVNEHEIAAADQARSKNVSQPVGQYADRMRTEHTANLEQARAVSQSANVPVGTGPQVTELRTRSEATRNQLMPMSGADYERAYIDAMVRDHEMTLQMLDQRLIPAAQNQAVRDYLTKTREAVALHLEAARGLQSQLGAQRPAAQS